VYKETLSNKFRRKVLTTSYRVNTAIQMVSQAILYHTQVNMVDGFRTIGEGIEVGLGMTAGIYKPASTGT
jgi:hypothetical protein